MRFNNFTRSILPYETAKALIFVLCICCLAGCHPKEKRESSIIYIDKKDLKEVSSFNPSDLIDSCTCIPLETSKDILIGNVHELQVTDKYIFVSDYSNNTLFVFDLQGKFLNRIGKQGRGPQEYQYLRSFCLTPNRDTVILYDGNLHRLQFYTPDNQYIRTIDLHKHLHRENRIFRYINGIHSPENGKILLNYNYMHLHKVSFSLYDYQKDSLCDIGYMPFEMTMPNPQGTFTTDDPIITRYQEITSCCIPFNDTIFQIQQNILQPRIVVPALKDRVIDDKLIRLQDGKEGSEAIRWLAGNGLFITNIHESRDYFFITYCDQAMAKEIIWNKAQNKGILVSSYDYYGHRYSPRALPISRIFDEEEDSPLFHTPELEHLKPHLTEDDNPVVIIYHLKAVEF